MTVSLDFGKNSLIVQSLPMMREIAAPLFECYGIRYFTHRRTYHDGRTFLLTTDPVLPVYFYKQSSQFILTPEYTSHGNCFMLSDAIEVPSSLQDAVTFMKQQCGFDFPFVMVQQCATYTDYFTFAASLGDRKIVDFYFNTELLDRFLLYYKDRAELIIKKAIKRAFSIDISQMDKRVNSFLVQGTDTVRTRFIEKTPINRYFMDYYGANIYFTDRELCCMQGICQGKTSKEIARDLKISYRTVESYIRNVKEKLNSGTKLDIIRCYQKHFNTIKKSSNLFIKEE